MKELEAAVAEGPTRPPGLEFLQVSIPLTRVNVPRRPTEVKGIPDLYYQELKDERKLEESKRAKTKKTKRGNPRRQLTVDDYYSSTPNDQSVAKAVGIKLPSGKIVSSTKANMEKMARDRGENISVIPKQGKAKSAKETPIKSRAAETTEQEVEAPKSSELFRGKIPKRTPAVTSSAAWPPQVGPPELTLDQISPEELHRGYSSLVDRLEKEEREKIWQHQLLVEKEIKAIRNPAGVEYDPRARDGFIWASRDRAAKDSNHLKTYLERIYQPRNIQRKRNQLAEELADILAGKSDNYFWDPVKKQLDSDRKKRKINDLKDEIGTMDQRQAQIIRECAKLRARIPDLREQIVQKRYKPAVSEGLALEQKFLQLKAQQRAQKTSRQGEEEIQKIEREEQKKIEREEQKKIERERRERIEREEQERQRLEFVRSAAIQRQAEEKAAFKKKMNEMRQEKKANKDRVWDENGYRIRGCQFGGLKPIPFDPELDPRPGLCFWCWSPYHRQKDCPEKGVHWRTVCFNCGRKRRTFDTCERCRDAHEAHLRQKAEGSRLRPQLERRERSRSPLRKDSEYGYFTYPKEDLIHTLNSEVSQSSSSHQASGSSYQSSQSQPSSSHHTNDPRAQNSGNGDLVQRLLDAAHQVPEEFRGSVYEYMEYVVCRNSNAQNYIDDPILILIGEAERVPTQFRRAIYLHLVARVRQILQK